MASIASPQVTSMPALKTPHSASMFPSELPRSPAIGAFIKKEEDIRTPITPPAAYTDFLKALSPAVSTPCTATSTRSAFSFADNKSGKLTPLTQPNSADSTSSTASGLSKSSDEERQRKTPLASAPLYPPSPFVRPPLRRPSLRTPTALRKLKIPESPTNITCCSTTITVQSPGSAIRSPKSASLHPRVPTPKSASHPQVLHSPFSPTSWYIDGKTKLFGPPPTGPRGHVSVRQIVTKTVTYSATPLEPAPRGKRRKID